MKPDKEHEFNDFVYALEARLDAGEQEYGDSSFSKHPLVLVQEIQEELLDVANWAFILYSRMSSIKDELEEQ